MGDFSLPPPCIPLRGCPVLAKAVPAGFPSPAQDYTEGRLSLDEHLIAHPEATFFVRVAGNPGLSVGARVSLGYDPAQASWFSSRTEEALHAA